MKRLSIFGNLLTTFILLAAILAEPAIALSSKAVSSININLSKDIITYRNQVKVSGTLSPAHNGVTVTIYQRVVGTNSYTIAGTISTNSSGAFTLNITPNSTSYIKVGWDGDEDHEAGESQAKRISVKSSISIYQNKRKVALSKKITLYGSVAPAHSNKRIWLQSLENGRWIDIQDKLVNSSSRFRFIVSLTRLKKYKFRVKFYDEDHSVSYSSQRSATVYWPNPFGVSKRYAKYIVIVKSRYTLYLIQHGNITKTFPVVIGKPSTPTPSRFWKIKEKNPRGRGSVQGPLVLRLYKGGTVRTRYGIHGTNQEYLLKRRSRAYSHGCIRMYNRQILWLTKRVPIGTPVRTM